MESNARLQFLISKYLNRSLTEDERVELLDYFDNPAFLNEIEERFGQEYEREDGAEEMSESHQQQLLQHVFEYRSANKQEQTRKIKLWPRIGIVAAVATLLVSAGIWFYKANYRTQPNGQIAYQNDVSPGKSGATLTLANGQSIRLNDALSGELAKEAGVIISKTADGQLVYELKEGNAGSDKINILATGNGETYQVRLPDGSLVWLNAASTLKYPASFSKHPDRRVELSGEAFFDIAKDKVHPFIVKTSNQEVKVLGTKFNVNAYADEPVTATALLEGSVKISSGKKQQLLQPGFQAVNNGSSIRVNEVNIDNVISWKEGDFYFERVDFRTVMRKIGRWYNVEVVYAPSVPANITSNGVISRDNNLSAVLKLIEKSEQVHFRVEGRKVYVSK